MTLLLISTWSSSWASSSWPASGPSVCVVSPLLQIRPDSTCADFGPRASCEAAAVSVVAELGEVESVQLLLRMDTTLDTPHAAMTNVSVEFTFENVMDHERIDVTMFQVGYVNTTSSPRYEGSGGGWRPDPLMPMDSVLGFDVPAGTSQPLWIDLRPVSSAVGHDLVVGVHNATIAIHVTTVPPTSLQSSTMTLSVPVTLTVVSTAMPSLNQSTLGTAWSGSWDDAAFSDYYGEHAWSTNATLRSLWYDSALSYRTPPDAIYLHSPRSVADFELLVQRKGVRWLALLDVTSLPLTPAGLAVHSSSRVHHGRSRVGGSSVLFLFFGLACRSSSASSSSCLFFFLNAIP